MTNFLVTMTDNQAKRWESVRQSGRRKYIIKRAIINTLFPAILIWALIQWTSFRTFLILLIIIAIPLDYAFARISWVYQEFRYENWQRERGNVVANTAAT